MVGGEIFIFCNAVTYLSVFFGRKPLSRLNKDPKSYSEVNYFTIIFKMKKIYLEISELSSQTFFMKDFGTILE